MLKKFLLIAAVVLAACDDDNTGPDPDPVLTLSPDSVGVVVGSTALVGTSVANSTASVELVSRNTSVATVNGTGTIESHCVDHSPPHRVHEDRVQPYFDRMSAHHENDGTLVANG